MTAYNNVNSANVLGYLQIHVITSVTEGNNHVNILLGNESVDLGLYRGYFIAEYQLPCRCNTKKSNAFYFILYRPDTRIIRRESIIMKQETFRSRPLAELNFFNMIFLCHGVPWMAERSSSLAQQSCVLMAESSKCGFESWQQPCMVLVSFGTALYRTVR